MATDGKREGRREGGKGGTHSDGLDETAHGGVNSCHLEKPHPILNGGLAPVQREGGRKGGREGTREGGREGGREGESGKGSE